MSYGQSRKLSNPNPSKEAEALYCYIQNIYGKKILSGQMWSGWGFDELNYIKDNTGKQPAILGLDFISESANNAQVQLAMDWWRKGGIPTIMWHWGAPSVGEGYEASKGTIDINRCFQQGTAEYNAFWSELKKKADHLQALRDANVPVLWRPFHELNGGWFWWGKGGPDQFKRLWTTMYNYFVNDRGLNNLIWVLCYTGDPDENWFPGNQYVDIAGADTYGSGSGAHLSMYNATKNNIEGYTMPIAYHECGIPPDPDQCKSQGAMWSWWMEWHTTYLQDVDKNYLRTVYNHDLVLTLDELPDILSACNNTNCPPTTLSPYLKIDGGAWQALSTVKTNAGTTVVLGPHPFTGGSWSWSGCGISGTAREQTLTAGTPCTATATYTNACGTKSTLDFKISINGVCCGNIASNGYPYCCTNSDPDGDGWGWENSQSCIVPGSPADIDQCGTVITGLQELSEGNLIRLFPVPCKDSLTIQTPYLLGGLSISTYSLEGLMISKETVHSDKNIIINTSQLKPGMYYLRIANGNSETVRKFIKAD